MWRLVLRIVVLPSAWLGLASLWLRPLAAPVRARLVLLGSGAEAPAELPPAEVLVEAEAVVQALPLAPLPVVDLPRLWVVALLLGAAVAFWKARRRARGRCRLVLVGTAGLLALGGVHVWTDLLDLWDQLLASGSLGQGLDGGAVQGGGWLADTKPVAGLLACFGLAGVLDRWCGERLAASCVGGVGLVVAQMWLFSVSGDLQGPLARAPLVAVPIAVFQWVFDGLWPELAGLGPLLFDDVVLQGAMIELLVFTNLAAALFLMAGLTLSGNTRP